MAEAEGGEKTEQASQQRIDKARERGDVSKSRELNSSIGLLVSLMAMKFFGTFMVAGMRDITQFSLTQAHLIRLDPATLQSSFIKLVMLSGLIVSPIFLILLVSGILTNYLQVGALFSFEIISFKFDKLNPLNGLKQLFSLNGLIETVKAILKLILVGTLVYTTLEKEVLYFQSLSSKAVIDIVAYLSGLGFKIGFKIAIAMLLLGIADLFYQRWSYGEKLKMTKQEVKDEHKQSEGSPELKRLIQEKQFSAAQKRMMEEVPKADVVITNPLHISIAILYDRERSKSPIVVAKGADLLAKKIREVALENDVPIVENKPIAWALYELDLEEEIPTELYKPVAEILARVYKMQSRKK